MKHLPDDHWGSDKEKELLNVLSLDELEKCWSLGTVLSAESYNPPHSGFAFLYLWPKIDPKTISFSSCNQFSNLT